MPYQICVICCNGRINAVSTGQVTGDLYTEGCLGRKGKYSILNISIYSFPCVHRDDTGQISAYPIIVS